MTTNSRYFFGGTGRRQLSQGHDVTTVHGAEKENPMKNNATKSRSEPTFTRTGSLVLSLAFALLAFLGSNAQAQSWTGNSNGYWSVGGNWSTGTAPVNGANTSWNGATKNLSSTNDIDGLSLNRIQFNNANHSITIGGNKITIAGAIAAVGATTTDTRLNTIDLPLELNAATVSFNTGNTGTLVVNGVVSETGGSRNARFLTGSGVIYLNGLNTFSGKVELGAVAGVGATVSINTLGNIGVAQPLGKGIVQFGNRMTAGQRGTLIYTGGATSTDKGFQIGESRSHSDDDNGDGAFLNNGTGAVVWAGTQTIVLQAAAQTRTFTLGGTNTGSNDWQSVIANNNPGPIALTKADAGKWILSGNNTYSGATTVSGGTLVINGNQSGATGTVTVVSGAALGGSGRTGGAVTLASGGKLKPGDTGGGIPSKLTIDGAFTYENGTLDLSGLTTLAGGTHVLATFPSRSVSTFASVVGGPSGATVGYTETSITLRAAPKGTVISIR